MKIELAREIYQESLDKGLSSTQEVDPRLKKAIEMLRESGELTKSIPKKRSQFRVDYKKGEVCEREV